MKVPKQTFATFTKEGVSRKYYASFYIHIQPVEEIKFMQIFFGVTVHTSRDITSEQYLKYIAFHPAFFNKIFIYFMRKFICKRSMKML